MSFKHIRRALIASLPTFAIASGAASAADPAHVHSPPPLGGPPLSILEVMRAAIEIPADGLWAAQGADKLTDDDWLLVEQDAIQLTGASSLVARRHRQERYEMGVQRRLAGMDPRHAEDRG